MDRSKRTTYLVADACDPDSFDRGGTVQVSYETKRQAKQPKNKETSTVTDQKKEKRNRGRMEELERFQRQSRENPVYQDEESEMFLFKDFSPALKVFVSNTDDRLIGRLLFGCESGVHSSPERGYKDGQPFELESSLDAMMARLTVRTLYHQSSTTGAGPESGTDMILAGTGSQFESNDHGMD